MNGKMVLVRDSRLSLPLGGRSEHWQLIRHRPIRRALWLLASLHVQEFVPGSELPLLSFAELPEGCWNTGGSLKMGLQLKTHL